MYGAPLFNGIGAEGSAGDPPVGKLPQSPDETSLLKTYGWKCAPHDDGSTQRGHGLFQGKALFLGVDFWRGVTAGKWWSKWARFFTGSTLTHRELTRVTGQLPLFPRAIPALHDSPRFDHS